MIEGKWNKAMLLFVLLNVPDYVLSRDEGTWMKRGQGLFPPAVKYYCPRVVLTYAATRYTSHAT